jgi:hypothetical protein
MKPKRFLLTSFALTLLLSMPPPGNTQTTVARYVLSNGALNTSGGTKVVRGTVGQPAAGAVVGPTRDAQVGFWYVFKGEVIGVNNLPTQLPTTFRLLQNHPNPVRSQTTIRFDIPEQSHAKLRIFDIQGRVVTTLLDESLSPGEYSILLRPTNLAAGIYWYRLEAGNFVQIRKLIRLQ